MQNINKKYWSVRVYYEDTDAGSIVFYANYLKFFERARTEFIRSIGLIQSNFLEKPLEEKQLFVVRSVQIDYLKPAFLDDILDIETVITHIGKTHCVFQQSAKKDDTTLCVAVVKCVCVNGHFKPTKIPNILNEFVL